MAANELTSLVVSLTAVGVVGAGLVWQMMRRSSVNKAKALPVSEDRRDPQTGAPVPNDHPEVGAQERPVEVKEFDSVGVRRPTMLALTSIRGDATAAEVFVQRAFKIDREFWRRIAVTPYTKKTLAPLFENACKLAWIPGCNFERHIYAVSFSPVVEEALRNGFHPRTNATSADLQICAIDETGSQLGEPMLMSDCEWGEDAKVYALWDALNSTDKPHELEEELKDEMQVLEKHVADLINHVSALTARNWQIRFDELQSLCFDIRRIGAEEGRLTCFKRINEMAEEVRAEAVRIDKAIAEQASQVKTVEDADVALQHAIAYMWVRELTVRFNRVCAILHVIGSDDYANEVHCANEVAADLEHYPDVQQLIDAAMHMAGDTLANGSRNLNDLQVSHAGMISRHAKELSEVHDTSLAELRAEVRRVQERIDHCLLVRSHSRRYAVRIDDWGRIEDFYVLEA